MSLYSWISLFTHQSPKIYLQLSQISRLIFSALAILRQSDSTCTCHASAQGDRALGIESPTTRPSRPSITRYHQHSEFEAPSWKWLLPSGSDIHSSPWKDPPIFNIGKPSINGPFSMAILNSQRMPEGNPPIV